MGECVGLCLSRECGLDVELWLRQEGTCRVLGEWRATGRDYYQPVMPERTTVQSTQVDADRHGTEMSNKETHDVFDAASDSQWYLPKF